MIFFRNTHADYTHAVTVPRRTTFVNLPHGWGQNCPIIGHHLVRKRFFTHPSTSEKPRTSKVDFKLERRDIKSPVRLRIRTTRSFGRFESGSFLLPSADIKVVSARSREQRKTFIYKSKPNGTVSVRNFYLCRTWHYF